ncbi:hypothetical protein BGX26_002551 [Mortierella sp. AD094]|nr:hypothetical protein BGX26_002551 [Mortierella sp. AD094]
MARFNQVLAYLMAVLLIAKTVSASFAYCIGLRDASLTRTVAGFYLWNDTDEPEGHSYDTITRGTSMTLRNNGWTVKPTWDARYILTGLTITNDKYIFDPKMEFSGVCDFGAFDYSKSLSYGCYDSGNGWCDNNRGDHVAACAKHMEMGSDSLSCPPSG